VRVAKSARACEEWTADVSHSRPAPHGLVSQIPDVKRPFFHRKTPPVASVAGRARPVGVTVDEVNALRSDVRVNPAPGAGTSTEELEVMDAGLMARLLRHGALRAG
jgi:hypothetical protein